MIQPKFRSPQTNDSDWLQKIDHDWSPQSKLKSQPIKSLQIKHTWWRKIFYWISKWIQNGKLCHMTHHNDSLCHVRNDSSRDMWRKWHVTKKNKNCSYTTRFSHFHSFGHFSECIHFVIMSRALIGRLRSWTWLVWTCVHWCRHWWWSCQTWNNELWLVEPHFKYNCIFVRLFFTFEMVFNYHCDTRKKFRFQVHSILTLRKPSNWFIYSSGTKKLELEPGSI